MDYQNIAAHSRVWIYQANRFLSDKEVQSIQKEGDQFIQSWAAHGMPLAANFLVRENLFLILLVDEAQAKASGCSIDSSVGFIKHIEKSFDLDLFDRLRVAYELEGEIKLTKMHDFEVLLKSGALNSETVVYNNLVGNKAELESNWKTTVKNSWHARLLP